MGDKRFCCIPGCLKEVGPKGMYLCDDCEVQCAKLNEQRKGEEYKQACLWPRTYIQTRVEEAIPRHYRDIVYPGQFEDADQRRVAFDVLRQRVRCQNFDDVYVRTVDAADLLLRKRGAFVLFVGPSGAGKTTLLAFLLRTVASKVSLVPKHKNPTFVRGGVFHDDWEDEENPMVSWVSADGLFEAERSDTHGVYKRVPLLALDDIGGEPQQANVRGVWGVVRDRHDAELGIAATTGFYNMDPTISPDENPEAFLAPLKERYSAAFVRRLVLLGPNACRIIPVVP